MTEQTSWQEWNPEDADLSSLLEPGRIRQLQPGHPLIKLKRALQMNMVSGFLILLFYIAIIAFFPYWQIVITMIITVAFTVYVLVKAWNLYRSIQATVSATRPVLEELRIHYKEISNWGRVQQKLGIFVYPFAAAGGYFCGGIIGSGKTIEELMSRPVFVYALPITILVLVPAGYWLAKWLFNRAFGKHLRSLEGIIQSLELDN